tara:strand:+ start:1417 stop:1980 length:564 start_codon:yes stop_codon:yes gene_type:complete
MILPCDIHNNTERDLSGLDPIIAKFIPFASQRMGFKARPVIVFQSDPENGERILGRTAHYDPGNKKIVIYIDGRHPKDMLRSVSHELVHHSQRERGEFDDLGETGEGYAQNNPHLRNMEREAYEIGNMVFRDFEDIHKKYLAENKVYTGKRDYMNNEEFIKKESDKEHEKKFKKLLKGFTKKEKKRG